MKTEIEMSQNIVSNSDAHLAQIHSSSEVLVVEDCVDNQILFKAYLAKAPLHVSIASNGLSAVELACSRPFDLIFMDLQMPHMDGFEAVRTLRGLGYEGKIIALTACAMKGDRELCLQSGFDDYLCKPLSRKTLLDCVLRHLESPLPFRPVVVS
ncbi:MAG: response regulator [Bdellovibrionales bacterium]